MIVVRFTCGLGCKAGGQRSAEGLWFSEHPFVPAKRYDFAAAFLLDEGPRRLDTGDPPPSTERLP
jgi:hypothetical protein